MIVRTLNSIEEKESLIFIELKTVKRVTNACGEELLDPTEITE